MISEKPEESTSESDHLANEESLLEEGKLLDQDSQELESSIEGAVFEVSNHEENSIGAAILLLLLGSLTMAFNMLVCCLTLSQGQCLPSSYVTLFDSLYLSSLQLSFS